TPEVPKGPTGPGAKSLALFAFLAVLIVGGEAIVLWTRRQQRLAESAPAAGEPAPAMLSMEDVPAYLPSTDAAPEEVDDPAATVPLLPLDGVPGAIVNGALEGHRLIAVVGSGD